MILEEHYQGALIKASREVVSSPKVDWKEAWQEAVKWAHRRYRRMVKTLISWRTLEEEVGEEIL